MLLIEYQADHGQMRKLCLKIAQGKLIPFNNYY